MTGSRKKDSETGLSQQQQRFADEYLVDYDGAAAYSRAGYRAAPRAAEVNSARLLAVPAVQAYLRQRGQRISAKLEISAERTLQELARVAFFDPRQLLAPDGSLKPTNEWSDDVAAAVAGLEISEVFDRNGDGRAVVGQTKKLRIASKTDALGKLAQHFKLLTDKVELTGKGGGPIQHEIAQLIESIENADIGIGPAASRRE